MSKSSGISSLHAEPELQEPSQQRGEHRGGAEPTLGQVCTEDGEAHGSCRTRSHQEADPAEEQERLLA